MRVSDFDFELPEALIATRPAEPRDSSRLLVYDRSSGKVRHGRFSDLPGHLAPGDLLVLNDTAVLPARLLGQRPGGGRVECLILQRSGSRARGYLKPAKKVRIGLPLAMEGGAVLLRPRRDHGGGVWEFDLEAGQGDLETVLARVGRAPLPPYIRRRDDDDPAYDRERYQTVYARRPGAVAAPTAGLHFTPELLETLRQRGVEQARVTLHVGEGTFAPVRVEEVGEHRMHAEWYELPQGTAEAVAATRRRGGRVVAVGTTAARTLETCARADRMVDPGSGQSELFLHPGVEFRVVDALLTNFHLPKSTLLMLVAAFCGRQQILEVYRQAIAEGYRFYSYGDAMLIL